MNIVGISYGNLTDKRKFEASVNVLKRIEKHQESEFDRMLASGLLAQNLDNPYKVSFANKETT